MALQYKNYSELLQTGRKYHVRREHLKQMMEWIQQDKFRKAQIGSVGKLLEKNKE